MLPRPVTFSYNLTFSTDRRANSTQFQELREISLPIFRLPLQRRSAHIWQLGRSNGGVVPTVTSDELDIVF